MEKKKVVLVVGGAMLSDSDMANLYAVAREVNHELNAANLVFSYDLHTARVLESVASGGVRGFTLPQFLEAAEAKKVELQADYVIVLTTDILDDDSFNKQDPQRGVGVVTLRDFARYLPAGSTVFSYACYLVLCVSILLRTSALKEHAAKEGCLFDMCLNQDDLIDCLRRPKIHSGCRKTLVEAGGYSENELEGIEHILKLVGHSDPLHKLAGRMGVAGASFLAGVVLSIFASVVATEWPRVSLGCAWVSLMLVAWILLIRRVGSSRLRSRRRHRWLSIITTSLVLAVTVAGVLVVYTGFPRLHSDPPSEPDTTIDTTP